MNNISKVRLGLVLTVAVLAFATSITNYVQGEGEVFWPLIAGTWAIHYFFLLKELKGRGEGA